MQIRDADLARDRQTLLRFIAALNRFEHQFDANRRLDDAFPEEFLTELAERAKTKRGRIFIAEDAAPLGWAMCAVEQDEIFVREEERTFGYVAEMYVDEAARGRHVGRKLLNACEDHFRALKLKSVLIGALAGNIRAVNAYRAAGYADYAVNFRKLL
jgi:ribosomal protein S18 acetylase RimI-like enzyme